MKTSNRVRDIINHVFEAGLMSHVREGSRLEDELIKELVETSKVKAGARRRVRVWKAARRDEQAKHASLWRFVQVLS